jgi:iron(II)-dependent oxidoreductase
MDWYLALGIVICAVVWVQIFVDYRKKLERVMPKVHEVTSRRAELGTQITVTEQQVQDGADTLEKMRRELGQLEDRRIELQKKANHQEMVLIPAGKFRMGSTIPGHDDEQPEHLVHLEAFYIDKYEVTNLQYKDFIDATGHRTPSHWRNRTFDAPKAEHPAVNVSWEDARTYCEWVGKRLPTEAEWEYAALGGTRTEYPWGRSSNPECANFMNPEGKTTPVDKFPKGKSSLGVWDMCGNVCEWVSDWYDAKYYGMSPESSPPGPDGGFQRVHRGGAYQGNRMDIRAAGRHFAMPNSSQEFIGFRCALSESDAD